MSAAITLGIWLVYVSPVDTVAMQKPHAPDWYGASLFLAPVAIGAVALAAKYRPTVVVYAMAFAVTPIAMGVVAASIQDERGWQRDARKVFVRYTHRFPAGRLGQPKIINQVQRYVTVCADERSGHAGDRFCTEINLTLPRGRQVAGGYRININSTDPEPTDCFGDAIDCG